MSPLTYVDASLWGAQPLLPCLAAQGSNWRRLSLLELALSASTMCANVLHRACVVCTMSSD